MSKLRESAKTCTKCGESKPTNQFGKDASKRDGLHSSCKVCDKKKVDWYAANREKAKANSDAWKAANREKTRAYAAKWAAANKARIKATDAARYAANPDRHKAKLAKWRAANPDKLKASKSAWVKANPEAKRIQDQNRRARKLANGGKLSPGLVVRLFKLQRGKCACCHVSLDDGYHLDHVIALALEGPNEDWNMQLLCGPCNLSKGAKHPVEFMQSRGYLL